MNKLCIPLLIVLLAIAGCSKDPSEFPSPEWRLKSATAYMTFYIDGQPGHLTGAYKWSSESYTPDGLVQEREYREEEHLEGPYFFWLAKESNTYEGGVLKERIVVSPTTETTRYTYTYSNGRLLELEEYGDTNGRHIIYKYEYNGSALPARMLQYHPRQGVPPGQTVHYSEHDYTYDAMGNVLQEHVMYYTGQTHTIERVYDEKGNLRKETINPGPGAGFEPYVRKLINYTYDAKGRITEREFSTNMDLEFQKWVYRYDDDEKSKNKGRVQFIDVYEATTREGREYKLKGLLTYAYDYY